MPDDPKPRTGLRRTISPPATAAQVTESDLDAAVARWRQDAPPALRDLLDAEPEEDDGQ